MSQSQAHRPIHLELLDEAQVTELTAELLSLSNDFGLEIEQQIAESCVRHLLYVQQVNSYINLTRITDLHDALVLHVLDSLALVNSLPSAPHRFLDMGTGAGFPGLPFHILTDSDGVLLDSVGKKINAVNAFIDALDMNGITGVHARLEEYARQESAQFDCVLARAVGSLPLLIEYATPFLSDNGFVLLSKALPTDDEINAGNNVADICGLKLINTREFDLPLNLGHRTVLHYQRVGEPRIVLPRAVGLASKSPLA